VSDEIHAPTPSRQECLQLLTEVAGLCEAAGCTRLEAVQATRAAFLAVPDQGIDPIRFPRPEYVRLRLISVHRRLADATIPLFRGLSPEETDR